MEIYKNDSLINLTGWVIKVWDNGEYQGYMQGIFDRDEMPRYERIWITKGNMTFPSNEYKIKNLPEYREGIFLIVEHELKEILPEREDLVSPVNMERKEHGGYWCGSVYIDEIDME